MIKNFRQETLDRNRAVPKATALEQLHQLAMALVTGSLDLTTGAGDPTAEQSSVADTPRRAEQNQPEKSGENRNYSMLGVNYNRTLASQRENIDASRAYSWEGESPVYRRVGNRK